MSGMTIDSSCVPAALPPTPAPSGPLGRGRARRIVGVAQYRSVPAASPARHLKGGCRRAARGTRPGPWVMGDPACSACSSYLP
eukprot:13821469-Alexandrium_andersonii.AAC.1